MKTAQRAYKKFFKDEKEGKHEITYLLWETIDELVSDKDLEPEYYDLLNEKIEWLETLVIDEGVRQARKEMAIIIAGISILCVAVHFGNKKFKEYERRVKEALGNEQEIEV